MEIPLFASGEENIYQAKIVDRPTDPRLRSVKVEAITIDSFFSTKSFRVAFVKCDVEGHEFHTFRGAQSMIQRSYPACLVEVTGNPDNPGSEKVRITCSSHKPTSIRLRKRECWLWLRSLSGDAGMES